MKKTQKLFKRLHFSNPGPKMVLPSGEQKRVRITKTKSKREEWLNKVYKVSEFYNGCVYDEWGVLHAKVNTSDLCDCTSSSCFGCFEPCTKCNSTKCGVECRRNRKWFYSGESTIMSWPTN
jgi:hypothetical protein